MLAAGVAVAPFTCGISGSISSHNSSETSGLAIVAILSHEVGDAGFVAGSQVPVSEDRTTETLREMRVH